MKIEKINEDKIRITLNLDDLKEKNIDFHSFMANPIESQSLFLDVLETAEKEIGFVTKNHKIILDALVTSDGNFVLTVTRNSENNPKKKIIVKRNMPDSDKSTIIYSFKLFEDVISFCKYIYSLPNKDKFYNSKLTSLFQYKNIYYIIFHNVNLNSTKLKSFEIMISEFGTQVANPDLFECKLLEFGTKIIEKNAINVINKNFDSIFPTQ